MTGMEQLPARSLIRGASVGVLIVFVLATIVALLFGADFWIAVLVGIFVGIVVGGAIGFLVSGQMAARRSR